MTSNKCYEKGGLDFLSCSVDNVKTPGVCNQNKTECIGLKITIF